MTDEWLDGQMTCEVCGKRAEQISVMSARVSVGWNEERQSAMYAVASVRFCGDGCAAVAHGMVVHRAWLERPLPEFVLIWPKSIIPEAINPMVRTDIIALANLSPQDAELLVDWTCETREGERNPIVSHRVSLMFRLSNDEPDSMSRQLAWFHGEVAGGRIRIDGVSPGSLALTWSIELRIERSKDAP